MFTFLKIILQVFSPGNWFFLKKVLKHHFITYVYNYSTSDLKSPARGTSLTVMVPPLFFICDYVGVTLGFVWTVIFPVSAT